MGGGGQKRNRIGRPDEDGMTGADFMARLLGIQGAGLAEDAPMEEMAMPSDPALSKAVQAGQAKAMGLGRNPMDRTSPAPVARKPLGQLINRARTMVPGGRPGGL